MGQMLYFVRKNAVFYTEQLLNIVTITKYRTTIYDIQ
jgi:hypothetical protein